MIPVVLALYRLIHLLYSHEVHLNCAQAYYIPDVAMAFLTCVPCDVWRRVVLLGLSLGVELPGYSVCVSTSGHTVAR